MSRSRFMSLPYLRPPVLAIPRTPELERLDRPEPVAAPGRRPEPVAAPGRRARRRMPVLGLRLASTLQPGQAGLLTDTVLARVLGRGREVGTVVLDLTAAGDIDADGCAALHGLHDRLRSIGTRLRVVAAAGKLRDRLGEAGLTHRIGPEAIHPSLRAAVLATYAALPGPGLVTADVRAALAMPAEALRLAPPPEV